MPAADPSAVDPEEAAYLARIASLQEGAEDTDPNDPFGLSAPAERTPPLTPEEQRTNAVIRTLSGVSGDTAFEEEAYRAQQNRLRVLENAAQAKPMTQVKEDAMRAMAPAPPGLVDPTQERRIEERLARLEQADKAMHPTLSTSRMHADRRTSIRQADLVVSGQAVDRRASLRPNSESPTSRRQSTLPLAPPVAPPPPPGISAPPSRRTSAIPLSSPSPPPPPPPPPNFSSAPPQQAISGKPMPPQPPPGLLISPSIVIAAAKAAVDAQQKNKQQHPKTIVEDALEPSAGISDGPLFDDYEIDLLPPKRPHSKQYISAPIENFNAELEKSRLKAVEPGQRPENKVATTNALDGEHLASVLARNVPVLSTSEPDSEQHKVELTAEWKEPITSREYRGPSLPALAFDAKFRPSTVHLVSWQRPVLSGACMVLMMGFFALARRWSFLTAACIWLVFRLLIGQRFLGDVGSLRLIGDGVSSLRIFQFESFTNVQLLFLSLSAIVAGRFVSLGAVIFVAAIAILVISPLYLAFPRLLDSQPFVVNIFPSLLPTSKAQVTARYGKEW